MNPRQFVTQKSVDHSGGYTVIPVLRGKCLDLPFHLKRLTDSYQCVNLNCPISYESVAYSFLNEINYQKVISSSAHGFMTIILSKPLSTQPLQQPSSCSLDILFSDSIISDLTTSTLNQPSLLSSPPQSETILETFPYRRQQASCKDIQWPQQRLFIERQKQIPTSNDVMMTHEGKYLEGLTSNFFVMDSKTKTIYACSNDKEALPGSMSRIFIAFCRAFHKDIKLVEDVPITNEVLSTCDSVFLTSATKPIFPISRLVDFYSTTSSAKTSTSIDPLSVLKKEYVFQQSMLLTELRHLFISGLRTCCESKKIDGLSDWLSPHIPYPLWWSFDDIATSSISISNNANVGSNQSRDMSLYQKELADSAKLLTKYINLI